MVVNGDYHEFEPEKLRGLMKILPEMDEVSLDNVAGLRKSLNWINICPIQASMKTLPKMDEVKS